jgi:hypothetical protein
MRSEFLSSPLTTKLRRNDGVAHSAGEALSHFRPAIFSCTRAFAEVPSCRGWSGPRSSETTDSAKSLGVFATKMFGPDRRGRSSAPTDVETTALLIVIASKIFRRVPPPMRRGTMQTEPRVTNGRMSSTHPVSGMLFSLFARLAACGKGCGPPLQERFRGIAF